MDKKSIIGLVLIFGIFVGYMWWVSPSAEERAAMEAERARVMDSIVNAQRAADSVAAAKAELDSLAAAGIQFHGRPRGPRGAGRLQNLRPERVGTHHA